MIGVVVIGDCDCKIFVGDEVVGYDGVVFVDDDVSVVFDSFVWWWFGLWFGRKCIEGV